MITDSLAHPEVSFDDWAAMATVPQRMIEAWAAHDAKAFSELFTDDGSLILPGRPLLRSKEQIHSFMAAAFAGPFKGTRVTGRPVNLRVISDDVGLLITDGGIVAAGASELADKDAIRASWLLVKRDRKWYLAAYQNGPRDV